MNAIELHAFNGRTGAHLRRLAVSQTSWSDNINEAGTIDATVAGGDELRDVLREYGTVVAAVSGTPATSPTPRWTETRGRGR